MLIDLSAILRGEIRELPIEGEIFPDVAPYGIEYLPGAHISGVISGSAGLVSLTSRVSVPYRGECARCLDVVEAVLEFDFNRTIVTEGTISDDVLEEKADEYLVVKRGILEPDDAIIESVFLELPSRLLCSPDCRGLCPKCGKKMTSDECGCAPREIDPRWNQLRKLLEDDE
ncbi:MAG: YceD family protein [Eubacteriales bacterium]